jgi:hypothetical protein
MVAFLRFLDRYQESFAIRGLPLRALAGQQRLLRGVLVSLRMAAWLPVGLAAPRVLVLLAATLVVGRVRGVAAAPSRQRTPHSVVAPGPSWCRAGCQERLVAPLPRLAQLVRMLQLLTAHKALGWGWVEVAAVHRSSVPVVTAAQAAIPVAVVLVAGLRWIRSGTRAQEGPVVVAMRVSGCFGHEAR